MAYKKGAAAVITEKPIEGRSALLVKDVQTRSAKQGGSTITQQLARSLLLTREKTLIRKMKEAILAFRIERHLTKEEILFLYLNLFFLD